jgi:methionyl-tRNA synthetase
MKKFFITTPIYYPNARPHVGSAYTTIVCDAIARYKRMCGYDVAFLTGTDEHGEKLQRAAEAAGKSPAEFVAEKRELFKNLWQTLGIPQHSAEHPAGYRFVHTSQNPDHVKSVQWMIRQAQKAGYIEKRKYEGRYCIHDERYVSDSTEPADCDICGRPAELISEENYFFRLSAFQDRLLKLYEEQPDFVRPDFRMNEVKSFVKSGLRDISISRKRLKWGVPWPDDPEQVVYVWYDALTSYLTGIGFRGADKPEPDFEKFWMDPEAERIHMIGKDILRFHAAYWPAFLLAAGLRLPNTIFAHGWIYYEQDKMSKSKGNVVYPEPIVAALNSFGAPGNDALRYYLLRDTPFGLDGSFSYAAFVDRFNFDLANDLGNLASRAVNMLWQSCEGILPPPAVGWGTVLARSRAKTNEELAKAEALEQAVSGDALRSIYDSGTKDLADKAQILQASFVARLESYEIQYALVNTWGQSDEPEPLGLIAATNGYLTRNAPWRLAQLGPGVERQKLETILNTAAEALRFLAVLLAPILPRSAVRLWEHLGCEKLFGKVEDQRIDQLQWGQLKPGTKVGKPEPIFPRLDKVATLANLDELAEIDRNREGPIRAETAQRGVSTTEQSAKKGTTVEQESEQKQVPQGGEPAPAQPSPAAADQKISIDDFTKVEMRVGEIISAEPIPKATRLLKIQVDIGTEVRQVCAGIAEYYQPEQLVGMKVIVVTNLAPRKLRGVESNGMIVAASVGEEGRPVLATFKEDVPKGARLK